MLQDTLKALRGAYGKKMVGQIFTPANEKLSGGNHYIEVVASNLPVAKWAEFKVALKQAGAVKHGPAYAIEVPEVGLVAFSRAKIGLVMKAWIPRLHASITIAQLGVRLRKELTVMAGEELALLIASDLTVIQHGVIEMSDKENKVAELAVVQPVTYITPMDAKEVSALLAEAASLVRPAEPAPATPVEIAPVAGLAAEAEALMAEAAALASQVTDPAMAAMARYLSLDTASRRLVEAGFSYVSRLSDQGVIDRSQLYDEFRIKSLTALIAEAERVGGDPKRLAQSLRLKFNVQTLKKRDGSTVVHNYRGSSYSVGQLAGYIVGAVGATVVAHRLMK